ncbi:glycosyltransferase family 2 protein [Mesonia sp. K7]|uniref:glycosyltransferase family 2 protein n=1 Tax=Mesonia sp. K7 TaxID=2218606 RepID=UPI000DA84A86|nr:glycosyltransferase family 2 protein [Mesonia sp. K7]PZD78239.1 glycosyltransferase family 2 protein [Mesonia sp. K7]
MKLKELPVSLFHTLKLKCLSVKELKNSDEQRLPIVVSLTAIPSRFSTLHIVIKSVLAQNYPPKKIVLWLHESVKKNIPKSLAKLEGEIFEIRYTSLDCPHNKLIHTLKLYPNFPVVTCDDDLIYRQNWLQDLYDTYLKYPDKIVAHRLRCIKTDEKGKAKPYKSWNLNDDCSSERFLPIGAEGVLYPPNVFSNIVHDENLFLKLAPKADDLWFKAVAFAEGKKAMKALKSPKQAIPILGTQRVSLKKENVGEDKNRVQWDALAEYFQIQFKN